jgi:hypothetical protein
MISKSDTKGVCVLFGSPMVTEGTGVESIAGQIGHNQPTVLLDPVGGEANRN